MKPVSKRKAAPRTRIPLRVYWVEGSGIHVTIPTEHVASFRKAFPRAVAGMLGAWVMPPGSDKRLVAWIEALNEQMRQRIADASERGAEAERELATIRAEMKALVAQMHAGFDNKETARG